MNSANIVQMGLDSLWHPITQHRTIRENPPTHIVKGEGCYLTDQAGNTYLDAVAGLWCVNVGYGRQELAAAPAVMPGKRCISQKEDQVAGRQTSQVGHLPIDDTHATAP